MPLLFRSPKPSKKSRRHHGVQGDFLTPDASAPVDTGIHILYETATTVFDNRIRHKCDKKTAHARRQQKAARSKTGKLNSHARKSRIVDVMEMFDDGGDDISDDFLADDDVADNYDDYPDGCFKRPFRLSETDFIEPWTKISLKKARRVRLLLLR
ncbi:unnamed protein product [Gongylonema pulchrum]|uniref:Uncharacterized protein n=1 Tax=Gongylonema pulchrum TaxID=637853 RepID=A0A183DEA6_9BILA|nr:unnamed protein product [Gongylonema pulchrum]